MGLLRNLRPEWWFAAHLHTRYQASVFHDFHDSPSPNPIIARNPDEVIIEDDEFSTNLGLGPAELGNPNEPIEEEQNVDALVTRPQHAARTTFLALDKCLPKRQFLEVYISPMVSDVYHSHPCTGNRCRKSN